MSFSTLFIIYHHVNRFHHSFGSKIVYLVCSAWCRISKKEPFITFWIKFFTILSVSKDVTITAKNSKIFHHLFLSSREFIWGLLSIGTKVHSVQGITCSVYIFSPKRLGILLIFNMTLAISWTTLFFLSTTPFCWGVLGVENSFFVPWSLQKDMSLEFLNSLSWSLLIRAIKIFFYTCNFLHRWIILLAASDLSFKRTT